ncbi:MAG: hypothetical protein ABI488_07340 [Polyangiaceae bacterium]
MSLFNGTRSVGWTAFGALLVALSATACGGGDDKPSGSADFGALQKKYASPSGTLSASDKDAIIKGLDQQSDASASGIAPAGARVGIGGAGKGPHVLDTAPFTCGTPAQGQTSVSCACTGGGTVGISGSASQDGSNVQTSESFNNCKFDEAGSSAVINGSFTSAEISSPPPAMTIIKEAFTETITPPGETIKIDLDYAEIGGMVSYSVDVADGNVVLSAAGNWDSTTDSGSFTVTTKDGTYSCSLTNGAGDCTGSGGSVTFS